MRAVRTLLRRNYWTSVFLMAMLMLWIMGGSSLHVLTSAAQASPASVSVQDCGDQAPDDEHGQGVLTSLEAGVIPVCKIQVAFFESFMQEKALVEQPVERVATGVPLPQSNYFRTLLRRIIPPNAP